MMPKKLYRVTFSPRNKIAITHKITGVIPNSGTTRDMSVFFNEYAYKIVAAVPSKAVAKVNIIKLRLKLISKGKYIKIKVKNIAAKILEANAIFSGLSFLAAILISKLNNV